VTAGLILSAGESRRMGFPKALLQYRDESFLDRLIGLFEPHCSPVIVVLGPGASDIRAALRRSATFITNTEWSRGQTSSLQCGLAAVPPQCSGVLLTLVDHPATAPETLEYLLHPPDPQASATGSPLLRIPRYDGRRGHPIWFDRSLIPEFLAIREPRTAKDVVHARSAETVFLDIDDPGIVADIDDPAAYKALTGASA
jgi:molybdenum cofactor cytidylyltransferase